MKYLIVNADDFGITRRVSEGIIEASEYGVVSSVTMFATTGLFDHCVSLLKGNRKVGVGVHLTLSHGSPVSDNAPSLTKSRGVFFKEAELQHNLDSIEQEDIIREFNAQIEKIKSAGIDVTHLDTHSDIHRYPKVCAIVRELARAHGLAVRKTIAPDGGVRTTTEFSSGFHNQNATDLNFKMLLRKYANVESLEIRCHPGYCDPELINKSAYSKKREIELKILTTYEVQLYIDRMGVQLINFGQLPG